MRIVAPERMQLPALIVNLTQYAIRTSRIRAVLYRRIPTPTPYPSTPGDD